jgi:hypothetical protein
VLIVSRHHQLFESSWPSPEKTISTALDTLKKDHLIKEGENRRLIVRERWRRRIYIVLDIGNDTYDPELGHILEHNNLPVLVVYFNKKGINSEAANIDLKQRVNRETAERHNLNGKSMPPYVVDYTTTRPVYLNPRDVSLLRREGTKN